MNKRLFFSSAIFLLGLGAARLALPVAGRALSPAGAKIVQAAQGFLAGLDEKQKAKASFAFDDKERFNWHFIPRDRKGIPLKELGSSQKQKLQDLLAASLSEIGLKTADQVRGLEEILQELEGPNGRFVRDPELYYASLFGTPGPQGRWGWRFEGHHLSLNFTLDGERVLSATPLFFGANPALVQHGPKKGLRVLAGVEDLARELMKSLDEKQRQEVEGKEKPEEWEIQGATSERYAGLLPRGLPAAKLSEDQQKIFERLVKDYIKHLPEEASRAIYQEVKAAGADQIQIAWRGGIDPFEPHSYIIHGRSFIISYANFQNGAAHVHSGFRLLKGEFGL
ncbi:MAG: DUF3500 domain-containing protein [Planctomycetes bacterium]|nr:DUF3500 domain-containing protein [Planctomycetota bacterium]